jgi:hypothetical protein
LCDRRSPLGLHFQPALYEEVHALAAAVAAVGGQALAVGGPGPLRAQARLAERLAELALEPISFSF